jgi:hypothetical protein
MTLNEMQLKIEEQEGYIQSLNKTIGLLLTYLGLRLEITPEHEIKLEEKGMEN